MSNPWLAIPLEDYEGHMQADEVQQLDALSELFAQALAYCRPASVAVLGIAGGNGLDRIDQSITKRIVGLDVNPQYLDVVRKRFAGLSGLELHCVNLSNEAVHLKPVQLAHAALVFEHAGADLCLRNAICLVEKAGALSVVLQLASGSTPGVSPSRFLSLQKLKDHFSLVDPAWLTAELARHEFLLAFESNRSLPAGKAFWMGIFRRSVLVAT